MARRAYSTEGERVSPPATRPGYLAGYLNLAAVHSLVRELSLLLINEGKSFVRNNLNFTLKSIHSDKIQPFAILMKQTRTV